MSDCIAPARRTHTPFRWSMTLGLLFVTVISSWAPAMAADPLDWPYWRGPEMNGISREKDLVSTWDPSGEEGSNIIWKREEFGTRSTPIVMNKRVYVLCRKDPGTKKEMERVVCLDFETGDLIWENAFNVFLSDVPDTRVAWSAVVGDPDSGNVFAMGVSGLFQCIDGESGKTIWSHSLSEEYGVLTTYGGRTNFPIVHEQLVYISGVNTGWGENAKPAHRILAFDKRNGQSVWYQSTRLFPEDTTYSAPVIANFEGQHALVLGAGDGDVYALQPRTGNVIWNYNASSRGINTTPLVVGTQVFCGHSEENVDSTQMGALFCLDGTQKGNITQTGVIWREKEMFIGKVAPLYIDGRIYAIDDSAKINVVDAKTGKLIFKKSLGTAQRSSPIYADGKIYSCEANGRWYVMQPTEKGVDFLGKGRFNDEECNGSPIVSHGRLFIPTSGALYCIGQEGLPTSADPLPALAEEAPIGENRATASVQLVPVESLLYPGQRQQFQVRLFNDRGQYLGLANDSDVSFQLDGVGSMDEKGKYTTPGQEGAHKAVTITAKVGEKTATAKIRVVPKLDWSFDFDSMQIPITWIGARYRHIAIDFDLYTALNEKDPRAGQLYIYLMTSFVNGGKPTAVFDDSTPRETWTEMLRYLNLVGGETKPKNLDEAKAAFDPSLELLKAENVITDWTWEEWSKELGGNTLTGPKLTVNQGKRENNGNGVMCKIATIPKGTRSQAWMGQTSFQDYTIQADVYAVSREDRIADIGLIAQRYTVDLMGEAQQMQIRTWPPVLRMAQQNAYQWRGNTWYTLKMKASTEDGKAVLRGKVWETDAEEPAEWFLVAEDLIPNTHGSPGLYGNAKNVEIFYDNLKVTNNEE